MWKLAIVVHAFNFNALRQRQKNICEFKGQHGLNNEYQDNWGSVDRYCLKHLPTPPRKKTK